MCGKNRVRNGRKLILSKNILITAVESHGSTGGPAHSSHEEEEEEAPKATSVKTVSCVRLGKYKGKLKQNAIVSH